MTKPTVSGGSGSQTRSGVKGTMAIVPGLGTVFAGEHGRSARVKGQRRSYHFRIEETMGFNDLPGMRQKQETVENEIIYFVLSRKSS